MVLRVGDSVRLCQSLREKKNWALNDDKLVVADVQSFRAETERSELGDLYGLVVF